MVVPAASGCCPPTAPSCWPYRHVTVAATSKIHGVASNGCVAAEKICEGLLIVHRTRGKIHALIQLGKSDDGHRAPMLAQGVQTADNRAVAVQIMYDPIRIDEIAEDHRAGAGRVDTSRSA